MKHTIAILVACFISIQLSYAQNFGDFPKIEKEKLLNDLDILYQGLDKFHSGMYWYTPKDSVDLAFQEVRNNITTDLNVLEYHKLIAPLVALTREDHTDIRLPKSVSNKIKTESKLLPLTFAFLGKELYCTGNGSNFQDFALAGKQIESINGETPIEIVSKLGTLFASDGYIKTVKYSDLRNYNFMFYYFYYYGQVNQFEIKFKDIEEPVLLEPLTLKEIISHKKSRSKEKKPATTKDLLEFNVYNKSTAYLGIHSFSNDDIKEKSNEKSLASFLERSFKSITENNYKIVIVDVSNNGGGSEGNGSLLYSYFGDDFQKYKKVRVKTQKAILDNGVDKPINLKALGSKEKAFEYKLMDDGSLERKEGIGLGLRAYKKAPKYKFTGKVYVIISPVTYSGSSEFSNMMYTNELATFVGQETGGGYLGNTSGYGQELVLPNSQITVEIPVLQFVMNVEPKLPVGRGVIPHYEVIPTIEQHMNGENAALDYVLEQLESKNN